MKIKYENGKYIVEMSESEIRGIRVCMRKAMHHIEPVLAYKYTGILADLEKAEKIKELIEE